MDEVTATKAKQRWLIGLLVVLAGALFLWRGVWRGLGDSYDYILIYAASRAWVSGENPYNVCVLQAIMQAADSTGSAQRTVDHSLYPPTTLVVLSPFGAIGTWEASKAIWLAFNVMLVPVLYWSLRRLGNLSKGSTAASLLAVLVLTWAPIGTDLRMGQTALLATVLIAGGGVLVQQKRTFWGGILWGAATALKFQLGGVFLIYLVLRRKYLAAAGGLLAVVGLLLIAHLNPEMRRLSWPTEMAKMMQEFASPGHPGYGGLSNPGRATMLHLPVLVQTFVTDETVSRLVSWAFWLVPAGWFGWRVWRRETRESEESSTSISSPEEEELLLDMSFMAIITLLPIYHRGYDAIVLLLPVAWAIAHWNSPVKIPARILLVLSLAFLTPGGPIFSVLTESNRIPGWVTQTWWWNGVVLLFPIWAMLGMLGALWIAEKSKPEIAETADTNPQHPPPGQ